MSWKMVVRIGCGMALLIGVMAAMQGTAEAAGSIDAKAAFEKLKALTGSWNGTTKEGISVPVSYGIHSNGSVVMETLFRDTDHEMITMYHMVGNDLLATHYCAIGNQPRFKLDVAKSTPAELVFAFDGGTSFDPAKDAHIHEGRLSFPADGKLDGSWSFYAGGERKGSHEFQLTRVETK